MIINKQTNKPKRMESVKSVAYPRTGKRGVPQQFPRRLYNMLESESQQQSSDTATQCLIAWSTTGKAFKIEDVSLFSTHVLPKYFRTSKFSSFQRNLNLVSDVFVELLFVGVMEFRVRGNSSYFEGYALGMLYVGTRHTSEHQNRKFLFDRTKQISPLTSLTKSITLSHYSMDSTKFVADQMLTCMHIPLS